MSEAEAIGLVIGIVAFVREKAPKIDGWLVVLAAAILSTAFGLSLEPELRAGVLRSLRILGWSVGGVAAANYGAKKLGSAVTTNTPAPVAVAAVVEAPTVRPLTSREIEDDETPTPREGSRP